eukprot:UN09133
MQTSLPRERIITILNVPTISADIESWKHNLFFRRLVICFISAVSLILIGILAALYYNISKNTNATNSALSATASRKLLTDITINTINVRTITTDTLNAKYETCVECVLAVQECVVCMENINNTFQIYTKESEFRQNFAFCCMVHLPLICRNCWGGIKTSLQVPHCPLCRMGIQIQPSPITASGQIPQQTHPPPIDALSHRDVQQGYLYTNGRINPEQTQQRWRFLREIAKLLTVDQYPF